MLACRFSGHAEDQTNEVVPNSFCSLTSMLLLLFVFPLASPTLAVLLRPPSLPAVDASCPPCIASSPTPTLAYALAFSFYLPHLQQPHNWPEQCWQHLLVWVLLSNTSLSCGARCPTRNRALGESQALPSLSENPEQPERQNLSSISTFCSSLLPIVSGYVQATYRK